MLSILTVYQERLCHNVQESIARVITNDSLVLLVQSVFLPRIERNEDVAFQRWYLSITGNPAAINASDNFYRQFNSRYSLRCTIPYTAYLQDNAADIETLIMSDPTEAYIRYFRRNDELVFRNAGVFYTKILHTYRPMEFAAVDNPIRDFFQLSGEGFYTSYAIINEAYRRWLTNNNHLIHTLRGEITIRHELDTLGINQVSDYKLLDMIFWWQNNRQ